MKHWPLLLLLTACSTETVYLENAEGQVVQCGPYHTFNSWSDGPAYLLYQNSPYLQSRYKQRLEDCITSYILKDYQPLGDYQWSDQNL